MLLRVSLVFLCLQAVSLIGWFCRAGRLPWAQAMQRWRARRLRATLIDRRRFQSQRIGCGRLAAGFALASVALGRPGFALPAVAVWLAPDVRLLLSCLLASGARAREIRFLRRLFILSGSVPPVSFDETLAVLIDHAAWLKPTLTHLCVERDRNSARMETVYAEMTDSMVDPEERIFFEKLSHADRIHFADGVRAMRADLRMARLIRRRDARVRKNAIEMTGVVFGVLLAGLLTLSLMLPWLSAAPHLMP